MIHKQTVFLLLTAAAFSAVAQSTPRRPPEELVPTILMSQAMVNEHKQACIQKYPELEAKIEAEHRAWVLYPIKIAIYVNGRKYTSPMATAARDMVRSEIRKKDVQRLRRDCSNFPSFLAVTSDDISKKALAPFLEQWPRGETADTEATDSRWRTR